jgi:hypothetical protein
MKTTIDLPEELVFEAKRVALARRVTLKTLVEKGLLREIQNPSPDPVSPLQSLRALDSSIWSEIPADSYVRDLRKDWP